jgi:hypothetical protein
LKKIVERIQNETLMTLIEKAASDEAAFPETIKVVRPAYTTLFLS